MIINVNITSEESIRRAQGRRLDPNTDTIYHIDDNPPP